MSNNDGGPAFPHTSTGMSLRDYFAAKAMVAIIAATEGKAGIRHLSNDDMIAGQCGAAYLYADAMLAAREEKS